MLWNRLIFKLFESPSAIRQAVRQAVRQAHGPEQRRRTHGPEQRRGTHGPEPFGPELTAEGQSRRAVLYFIFRHCSVAISTPHSSRFVRLAYGAFYCAVLNLTFY